MKSQTSLAARNCRLQEWSKMVHSCNNRPIGMSVNEWCRENSITTANYYYRMTQVCPGHDVRRKRSAQFRAH